MKNEEVRQTLEKQVALDLKIRKAVRRHGAASWQWMPWADRSAWDDGQLVFADGKRGPIETLEDSLNRVHSLQKAGMIPSPFSVEDKANMIWLHLGDRLTK